MTAILARSALWALLLAPLAVQLFRYAVEFIYYGEFLGWTGVQSARLLLLTLALTPLRRWLPPWPPLRWLVRQRRDLGLATFVYALAHTLAYLHYKADLERILTEAMRWDLIAGWAAFAVFVVLAGTSNDASVRGLGRRWRTLHRSVYAAAVLTFVHWILSAFDPAAGGWHAGALAFLLALRLLGRVLPPGEAAAGQVSR